MNHTHWDHPLLFYYSLHHHFSVSPSPPSSRVFVSPSISLLSKPLEPRNGSTANRVCVCMCVCLHYWFPPPPNSSRRCSALWLAEGASGLLTRWSGAGAGWTPSDPLVGNWWWCRMRSRCRSGGRWCHLTWAPEWVQVTRRWMWNRK